MKKEATILAFVLYFPLLIYSFLLLMQFEVIYFNYLSLFYFVYIIYRKKLDTNPLVRNNYFKWFILFNICYAFIGFINFIAGGIAILNYFAKHYGVFLSIAMVYYLSLFTDSENIELFDRVVKFIGFAFLFQLCYSIYESLFSDVYIVNSFDWNGTNYASYDYMAGQLSERMQIDLFFQYLQLPFKLVFTGMLGQHNHWGTQLPFYNLIFLYKYFYHNPKKKIYLFLVILIFIAAIFNTSRFGIIACVGTLIFYFSYLTTISKKIKYTLGICFIAMFVQYLGSIVDIIGTYISLTDTMSTRQENWSYLWPKVWDRNLYKILFGSTLSEISQITSKMAYNDFENLSYTIIFEKGLLVYLFFVVLLIKTWKSAKKLLLLNNVTMKFIVINIIVVSLWSGVVFRYTSYAFLTLLLFRVTLRSNDETMTPEMIKDTNR